MRLIGHDDKLVGIVNREKALELARENELDLVLISPKAQPPVCKIIDYDKYRYQQIKKKQKAQKKQKKVGVKELRLRPNISPNDLQIKIKRAEEFILDHQKVRLTLQLVGRETLHANLGFQIVDKMIKALAHVAKIEQEIKKDFRNIVVILAPLK